MMLLQKRTLRMRGRPPKQAIQPSTSSGILTTPSSIVATQPIILTRKVDVRRLKK